jgi:hypothetical protein
MIECKATQIERDEYYAHGHQLPYSARMLMNLVLGSMSLYTLLDDDTKATMSIINKTYQTLLSTLLTRNLITGTQLAVYAELKASICDIDTALDNVINRR